MPLVVGERFGPYQVVSLLGAGGMGEVYRARDTRLERTVAIKVLSAEIDTPDAREQFDREARAISSLQMANICALYDVGIQDGRPYLVMEYLEGETLSQRLGRGGLSLDKTIEYATQIAEALDNVHREGLVHRDLKPANIMLTRSGLKLLDFGLAKIARNPQWLSTSTDQTHTLTGVGPLLGTCHYIAPELLVGGKPDTRADIFAFGAVLYEMLTGRRAFEGKTQAVTIAQVLEHEPPPIAPATEPPGSRLRVLEHIVKTCLAKNPDERRQTAHDILLDLRWLHGFDSSAGEAVASVGRTRSRLWAGIASLVLLAVAILGLSAVLYRRPAAGGSQPVRASILAPEKASFVGSSVPALSPDGRRVAFTASSEGKVLLWVRDLDSGAAWSVSGTDNSAYPFWSPSSDQLAFFAAGKLKKVKLSGGPAVVLCDAIQGRGGSWSRHGTIVFARSTSEGIFRIPDQGGAAVPVTTLDSSADEVSHRWPWFLPDGRHFLFSGRSSDPGRSAIYVADLQSSDRRRIQGAGSNAAYSPPGFLLFVRERTLMAQPFDAAKINTSGDPFPIADSVDFITGNMQGSFTVSSTGTVAYYSGAGGNINSQLTWVDRTGKKSGTLGEPGSFVQPVISPDGSTLAVDRLDPRSGTYDVWQYDLARGSPSRLTFGGRQDGYPVWSPDGTSIVFSSNRKGHFQLYRQSVGTGATPELLLESNRDQFASDWSRDGRYLVYYEINPATKYDIWALPMTGDRKPIPLLTSEFNEHRARVSPDSRWLAYTSDETSLDEIYVQAFPGLGKKWKVSVNGGTRPVWSRDGKELYYIGADRKLRVAAVRAGAKFETGAPMPLFEARQSMTRFFAVSPDTRRFLLIDPLPEPVTPPMNLLLNWTATVKRP